MRPSHKLTVASIRWSLSLSLKGFPLWEKYFLIIFKSIESLLFQASEFFVFFSNQRTHSPNPSSLDIEPVAISEATRPKLNPNQWHDLSSFIFGELILEFVSSYVIGNNPCLISRVSSAVLSFWIKFKFQDQIWVQRRHNLWWLELFCPGNEKEEQ